MCRTLRYPLPLTFLLRLGRISAQMTRSARVKQWRDSMLIKLQYFSVFQTEPATSDNAHPPIMTHRIVDCKFMLLVSDGLSALCTKQAWTVRLQRAIKRMFTYSASVNGHTVAITWSKHAEARQGQAHIYYPWALPLGFDRSGQ